MSAPDLHALTELEELARTLFGGVRCLERTARGLQMREDREAVEYLADTLKKDVDALDDWFEAAHKVHHAAKGNGPCAVT